MTARTQTFTYPCGHAVTVRIDGRRHGGGHAACRVRANIRSGKKCVKCRRGDVLNRLACYSTERILQAFLQNLDLGVLESIADIVREKEESP